MTSSNTALITGASSGIGLELAHVHAKQGGDLVVVAVDLSQPDAAKRVYDQTELNNIEIEVLINNAGFGGHGEFHQRDINADKAMIQVNITTLTELTHYYLKGMVARNSGKILNVSSTASFMPGPLQSVYYATKAYVTSFTQAIAQELEAYNVTATALCPGAVATDFVKAGDLDGVGVWDNAKTAQSVAQVGYRAMQNSELVAFNESGLKFLVNWITPLLPRKLVLKLSRQAMEKTAG